MQAPLSQNFKLWPIKVIFKSYVFVCCVPLILLLFVNTDHLHYCAADTECILHLKHLTHSKAANISQKPDK